MAQIESVEETIARFDAEIIAGWEEDQTRDVVRTIDTIPRVGRLPAEMPVAEIGIETSRFTGWACGEPGGED